MNPIQKHLTQVAQTAEERATAISLHSPDHGPRHWRDVARIALLILQADPSAIEEGLFKPYVAFLFAALHDTQRQSEFFDPEHGHRAASHARHMKTEGLIALGDDFELLNVALMDHDTGQTADNPAIAVCWDADRLTLSRVGTVPTLPYFSTAVVHDRGEFALWNENAETIMAGPDMTWSDIANLYEATITQ